TVARAGLRYKGVMRRLSCLKGEATGFTHPTERFTRPGNLPLNRGSSMRIGCGLRVHRIDGNEYLYFWHYERENGRSRRRGDYLYPGHEPTPAAMALEAILQALWFFLPAFVANPMAVVFGGGTPIDFGRTLGDRERLFGDGKTWRGLLGGMLSGAFLGFLL